MLKYANSLLLLECLNTILSTILAIFTKFSVAKKVTHHYSTRFNCNNNLNIPMSCSSKYRCSFYVNGIKLWNKLPNILKSSPSIFSFKKNFRGHLSNFLFSDWMWVLNASKTAVSIYACKKTCMCLFLCTFVRLQTVYVRINNNYIVNMFNHKH